MLEHSTGVTTQLRHQLAEDEIFFGKLTLGNVWFGLSWKKDVYKGRMIWVTLPKIVTGYFSEAWENVDIEEVLKTPIFLNNPCKTRVGVEKEEEHTSRPRF